MAEDDVYAVKSDDVVFTVRISKTTQGQRTYTVGASVPDDKYKPGVLARLFDIEARVAREIDGPRSSAAASGNSLTAQMRRTIVLNVLRQAGDWLTTPEVLARSGGALRSRSQLVADLSRLAKDGNIQYEQGTGRHQPSRYRINK